MKPSRLRIGLTAAAAVLIMSACNASNQSTAQIQDTPETVNSGVTPQTPKTKNQALNAMYPHYLELQKALVAGNIQEAQEAALLIEEAAKSLPDDAIQQQASALVAAKELKEQRSSFASLSTRLIQLIRSSGVIEGEFYVAHCPMAENHQGADWISPTKEIRNPYFGDDMLTCGSVTETLKH